jgi:hypothetical protein
MSAFLLAPPVDGAKCLLSDLSVLTAYEIGVPELKTDVKELLPCEVILPHNTR